MNFNHLNSILKIANIFNNLAQKKIIKNAFLEAPPLISNFLYQKYEAAYYNYYNSVVTNFQTLKEDYTLLNLSTIGINLPYKNFQEVYLLNSNKEEELRILTNLSSYVQDFNNQAQQFAALVQSKVQELVVEEEKAKSTEVAGKSETGYQDDLFESDELDEDYDLYEDAVQTQSSEVVSKPTSIKLTSSYKIPYSLGKSNFNWRFYFNLIKNESTNNFTIIFSSWDYKIQRFDPDIAGKDFSIELSTLKEVLDFVRSSDILKPTSKDKSYDISHYIILPFFLRQREMLISLNIEPRKISVLTDPSNNPNTLMSQNLTITKDLVKGWRWQRLVSDNINFDINCKLTLGPTHVDQVFKTEHYGGALDKFIYVGIKPFKTQQSSEEMQEKVKKDLFDIKRILDHEITHIMQRNVKADKTVGLGPKIRKTKHNPIGQDKKTKIRDQVHSLRSIEFYPNLINALYRFNERIQFVPPEKHSQFIRNFVGLNGVVFEPKKYHYNADGTRYNMSTNDTFKKLIQNIKTPQENKAYQRAVNIFLREIAKKGYRV